MLSLTRLTASLGAFKLIGERLNSLIWPVRLSGVFSAYLPLQPHILSLSSSNTVLQHVEFPMKLFQI